MFDPLTVYLIFAIAMFFCSFRYLLIYSFICYYADYQTFNATIAQKDNIRQQQQQKVSAVQSPDGVFTNQRFRRSYVPVSIC